MMTETLCARYQSDETISRFAAGTLPDSAAEDFERHLIGCADCQREVRLAAAIRREASALTGTSRHGRVGRRAIAAAVALAAAIVAVSSVRQLDNRELRALGAVARPPEYAGVAVRRDAAQAESLFEAGMQMYSSGRFRDARQALMEARSRGADSVPTSFFIGATRLIDGDDRGALRELQLVLDRPQNAYTAEAHYYAAKAWLRRPRADSALAHLNAAVALGGPLAATAQALADSAARLER